MTTAETAAPVVAFFNVKLVPVTPVTFSLKVAVMLAVREKPVALLMGVVLTVGRGPVRNVHDMPANVLPATSLIAVVNVAVYLVSAARSAVGFSVATRVVALYVASWRTTLRCRSCSAEFGQSTTETSTWR